MAPGSPPDDPVRGLAPCFIPPRMLQSGASFCHILSAASHAPVRGTGFTPRRSSPGASAVLLPAPDAPTRGVFLSYSLHCLGRCSPQHRVHPRTFQSSGLRRASFLPGCSNPGGLFCRTLSAASDAPVRGAGLTPGRSSPGANAVLHSAPVAPFRGVCLSYSPRCLGRSSPWHRVQPPTIQSGGSGRAPTRPGCSNPGRHLSFSPC